VELVRSELSGPYCFEDANGQPVTVTSDRYLVMLQEFLHEERRQWRVDTRLVWFQQDGATTHTARTGCKL
jgi:hypothetical protein